MSSATQITNLLHRYAELVDSGDFDGVGVLFARATLKLGDGKEGNGADLGENMRTMVRLYPCGTPRTKHVVTNAIVEVDEAAGTAACRSYYSVLQQTETLPLQVICAGRYHDRFVRENGEWRFAERDYSLMDLIGDLSQHLLLPLPAQGNSKE